VIPIQLARSCVPKRDRRVKPGDDEEKRKIKLMQKRRLIPFAELERRRARRDYMRRYRARKGKGDGFRPYVMTTVVPCAVEAEREAALAASRTPDQLLLGDPLPGRSALDRKNARASKRGIW
jgi:hypothetical protein